ncbi:type III secretion system needle complex protein [[Erwinia] mediterraneensis]|uniref:type III secretion system needle complex protein n=1 Tax=[Erwinia] mediterraneensis TaxID=2161819 RepID=UPI00102FC998|nr:type III secretion system needle complex protein [[Erwinia] mediterraneensis]
MADNNTKPVEPVLPNLSFDAFLSRISVGFDIGVADLNDKMRKALDLMQNDPSNPTLLANYQAALSAYTLYRNAQSNTVKVYKDVDAAIISNFR